MSELSGPVTREKLLLEIPEWENRIAAYIPIEDAVERLRSAETPLHIEVYFGTWCLKSAQFVPALFKILDQTGNPLITASLTALPQDADSRTPYLNQNSITRLPTFILKVSGEEEGRIVEQPTRALEEDLADLLPASEKFLDLDFFVNNYHADLDVDCSQCHCPALRNGGRTFQKR